MKKTLYVTNCGDYEITLDGPSLWVKKPETSGFRIPLRILDYVYVHNNAMISYEVLMALFSMKIPVAFYKNKTNVIVHITPYYDSGYFYDLNQRLISKKKETIDKFNYFMLKQKRDNQINTLSYISLNLGKAFNDNFFREEEYIYQVIKNCEHQKNKFFILKKILRGMLRQIIIKKCIDNDFDPKIGIINTKDSMGLVKDINVIIDPILDIVVIEFLKTKQKGLWCGEKELTNQGIKLLSIIYEKHKESLSNQIGRIINSILKIFNTGEL